MKSVLNLDETLPALERFFKAAATLRHELPTDIEMESIPLADFSFLAEDIHVKTWKASQNTDLDMWEFLGINKALQRLQGERSNKRKLTRLINA